MEKKIVASSGKSLKKKSRNFYSKTDLDFSFPSSCQLIKETEDEFSLVSYGDYPPQIRCFDLTNLSLKFKRHIDSNIIDFQLISKDWTKILFLRTDKFLEFHTKSGVHFKTKIDANGNDLLYDKKNNIAYITSHKEKVFRLDLEEGKFLVSLKNKNFEENTCSGFNSDGSIIGFGSSSGCVNFWDPRITSLNFFQLKCFKFLENKLSRKITSIRFHPIKSFECFLGFGNGEIILFDIRCFAPLIGKKMDQKLPINCIRIDQDGHNILSSNSKQIKIWNKIDGKTSSMLESSYDINHICKIRNSGFIFLACQKPKIEGKYIKKLGMTPSWIISSSVVRKNKEGLKRKVANKKKKF
jgi:ribosome biogenesis protein ENP2